MQRHTARLVLSALSLFALALACDNPVCVFSTTGCSGGGDTPIGGEPATPPGDHVWVSKAPPTLTQIFPTGSSNHPDTSIAITFSESMSVQSLSNAIQLVLPGGTNQLVPLLPGALVGDGRIWVLFPAQPLFTGQTYELVVEPDATLTDLTGNVVTITAQDGVLGTFGVAATAPPIPKVVTSWPPDNAVNQSTTGQVVVVFDRPINASSVDTNSFDILVNGVPPPLDPLPQALLVFGPGQVPVTDTRVYTWRSVDNDGEAVSLGTSATVEVTLSPSGNKILAEDGGALPETILDSDTAAFSAPVAAEIVSVPEDAIGIANLTGGDAFVPPLQIALTIPNGQVSDVVTAFLFGDSTTTDDLSVALARSFDLGDVPYDPVTQIATITEAELELASSTAPLKTVVADGSVRMAFSVQRGSVSSPVKVLDTDPDLQGTQDPLLDTQEPSLIGWSTSGTETANFRSDVRNFVLVGRADEELASVVVSTSLGDNGILPPVVASDENGLFLAQPFPQPAFQQPFDPALPPLAFQATLFDRAFNSRTVSGGSFTQLGVCTGNALPGASVTVQVFDAETQKVLPGAKVWTHQDFGGVVQLLGTAVTDSQGLAFMSAAPAGDTLVSAEASGYDIFTFAGATTDRVSLPLAKTSAAPALVNGLISSSSLAVSSFERNVSDSRLFDGADPLLLVQVCSTNPVTLQLECPYGPFAIQPGTLGALAASVTNTPASEVTWAAQSFLQAFSFAIPFAPVGASKTQSTLLFIPRLLSDPSTPVEDQALDGPATTFDAAGIAGLALGQLAGGPRVLVQGQVPGLRGDAMVGRGAAFALGGNQWRVRCAYPGSVDPTSGKYQGDVQGDLVTDGTIDPDLFLFCELRDVLGAVSASRPRFSALGPGLLAPDAPVMLSPTPGSGHTGSGGFAIDFTDVIAGQPGIYAVSLVGSNGRLWRLMRVDGGGGTATVEVPDLASAGGTTLPNGTIGCTVQAYAWPSFQSDDFLWTDISRDFDRFSQSAPVTFVKP